MTKQPTKRKRNRQGMAQLRPFIWQERVRLGLSLILHLMYAALILAIPVLFRRIFDEGLGDATRSRTVGLPLFGLMLLILLGIALTCYFAKILVQQAKNRISRSLQMACLQALAQTSVLEVERFSTGDLTNRFTEDLPSITSGYLEALFSRLPASVPVGIGALILLLNVSPIVALAIIPFLALMVVLAWLYRKGTKRLNHLLMKARGEWTGFIAETLRLRKRYASLGCYDALEQRGEAILDDFARQRRRWTLMDWSIFTPLISFSLWVPYVLICLLLYLKPSYLGVLTAGLLFLIVDVATRSLLITTELVDMIPGLAMGRTAVERISEILQLPAEVRGTQQVTPDRAALQVKNLSFAYEPGHPVLKNISFELNPGESLALVGRTGSGKSTLLQILQGFYPYEQGSIEYGGTPLKAICPQKLRESLGIVRQSAYLFAGTLEENIRFYRPEITREACQTAFETLGGTRQLCFEKGLDTLIEARGANLSAGESQLVSLMRLAVHRPQLILLDEATASIDTETEAYLSEAIQKMTQGVTTVIVAHRLTTIQGCDQILVLKDGEIVERGNHDGLIAAGGLYAQYWRDEIQQKQGEEAFDN